MEKSANDDRTTDPVRSLSAGLSTAVIPEVRTAANKGYYVSDIFMQVYDQLYMVQKERDKCNKTLQRRLISREKPKNMS